MGAGGQRISDDPRRKRPLESRTLEAYISRIWEKLRVNPENGSVLAVYLPIAGYVRRIG